MIVCKFGGTCSASSTAVKNIAKIKKNKQRKIFVFSAIGKESLSDTKMTDWLISLSKENTSSATYQTTRNQIIKKFQKLIKTTNSHFNIEKAFHTAEEIFAKTGDSNFLISRGEFFTAQIMAEYLKLSFVPAEDLIFFKEGQLDEEKTKNSLLAKLTSCQRFVMPAFYGIDEKGQIHLLSRGGGDFSGAILAKLLQAKTYENWTDVEGIYEVNPKILKSKVIPRLSFSQLEIMTQMDSTVIHKDCAPFLKTSSTKLKIQSCLKLSRCHTIVDSKPHPNAQFICYETLENKAKIFVQNKQHTKIITTPKAELKEKIQSEYKNFYTKTKNS